MKRISVQPRVHWREQVEKLGLVYHTPEGQTYWDESVCYRMRAAEVDTLEAATEELQRLCLAAGQYVIDRDLFEELQIPVAARSVIRQAWDAEPPSIYGRFDLSYDGDAPPKLLEYNADTPTALLEAAVVQWQWQQEVFPSADQFNSIHEKLIEKWTELKRYLRGDTLHFTCMPTEEDVMTVAYLRDTAQQAGLHTKHLYVRELGWRAEDGTFRDLEDLPVQSIFALYPWEWLLKDFAEPILSTYSRVHWMEPIWKMLWSNKGLLAILWKMFPNHPNLLPSYLNDQHGMRDFVRKPLLSREGANITIRFGGQEIATDGPYGEGGFVYQAVAPGWRPQALNAVIGSWYITDRGPAGVGFREGKGITDNLSRFVPHYFD